MVQGGQARYDCGSVAPAKHAIENTARRSGYLLARQRRHERACGRRVPLFRGVRRDCLLLCDELQRVGDTGEFSCKMLSAAGYARRNNARAYVPAGHEERTTQERPIEKPKHGYKTNCCLHRNLQGDS
jgi:hypothetical protein